MSFINPPAISLQNVNKTYKLYSRQSDQLKEVLGLSRIGIKPRTPAKEFVALQDVSLTVPQGGRIGVVGRNGAGKTTLLKLICGNFAPTSGNISVNGDVQALLLAGHGFHPDYTGRDNVQASLQYNGLKSDQYEEAILSIEEFCELGDFFDQPFKTYSSGMQARLMFAAATAVQPDILIVDEVLGAGDAYFIAKSKRRVEALVAQGCSMLLVSHAMSQILELCTEAIWLDNGAIRMQGDSFEVVKAYEEFMHGSIQVAVGALPSSDPESETKPEAEQSCPQESTDGQTEGATAVPSKGPESSSTHEESETPVQADAVEGIPQNTNSANIFASLQEPRFWPNTEQVILPTINPPNDFRFTARGGISRWDRMPGFKITGFTIVTESGESNQLACMKPARFVFTVESEKDGEFDCRYAIVLHDHMGRCKADILSSKDSFSTKVGERRAVEMLMNPVQLGPGEYTISVSVHAYDHLEVFNATPRYDLLSRSFEVTVHLPDSLRPIESEYYHSAQWTLPNHQ